MLIVLDEGRREKEGKRVRMLVATDQTQLGAFYSVEKRKCFLTILQCKSPLHPEEHPLFYRMLQLLQPLHFPRTLPNFCLLRRVGEWDGIGPYDTA